MKPLQASEPARQARVGRDDEVNRLLAALEHIPERRLTLETVDPSMVTNKRREILRWMGVRQPVAGVKQSEHQGRPFLAHGVRRQVPQDAQRSPPLGVERLLVFAKRPFPMGLVLERGL